MALSDHIKPLSEIEPEHNFLMGYTTGVEKKWWHGIEGITSIFMGAWSDPYIGYKGYALNAHLIDDAMWDLYNQERPAPDCLDREAYARYEGAEYDAWLQEEADSIFEMLDEYVGAYRDECRAAEAGELAEKIVREMCDDYELWDASEGESIEQAHDAAVEEVARELAEGELDHPLLRSLWACGVDSDLWELNEELTGYMEKHAPDVPCRAAPSAEELGL